jgi:hypothetical protein
LLKINQIILNENYNVVVDEFPQMKEREYFSSIYPELFYPKKVISVQIISFFRKKSTTNLPGNSINIQIGNSIKIKMDSNKINQLESHVKLLKQKLLKSQLDVNFKDLQIKSLEDEIESQNKKHQSQMKSLEDEFKTQKKNHEKVLNQFHIESQKIIEEAFSESSPITPPQNYTDPMIETNPKKRKFDWIFIQIFFFLDLFLSLGRYNFEEG